MKACDERGYVFRSEKSRASDKYVYCIAFDPAAKVYKGLKLEREHWSVVDEVTL